MMTGVREKAGGGCEEEFRIRLPLPAGSEMDWSGITRGCTELM
jgi:hypothetical protein